MSLKKLFTLVVLALHLHTLEVTAQSCANYCTNFEEVTTSCEDQDLNISGSGPITLTDVNCMCTVSNSENIAECALCNLLSGASLELLEAWVIVCYTSLVSGIVAAENCFNQELIKGSIGAPCASASSTTVTSTPLTTVSTSASSITTVTTKPSTTPVTSPTAPITTPTPSQTPVGAIVGGLFGGIAVITIAAILIFFFIRRSKNQKSQPQFSYPTAAPEQPTLQGPPPPTQQFNYPPVSQYPFPSASSAQRPSQLYTASHPEKQTLSENTRQVYDSPQPSDDKFKVNSSDNRGSTIVPPYSPPVNYETGYPQQNNSTAPRQKAYELGNMSPYNT